MHFTSYAKPEPQSEDAATYLARQEAEGRFAPKRPIIVCLCGSTRFYKTFQEAGLQETLDGKIVLSIGAALKSDEEHFGHMAPEDLKELKDRLDTLHLRKIDLADEVLILNVGGYIGESTKRELQYALMHSKHVRYLEPPEPVYSPQINQPNSPLATALENMRRSAPEPELAESWVSELDRADTEPDHEYKKEGAR